MSQMNLDIQTYSNNAVESNTNLMKSFAETWNVNVAIKNNGIMVNLNDIDTDKIKAFTGGSTAAGSGLIDVTSQRLGKIMRRGGVFTEIGDYVESAKSDVEFTNLRTTGSLIATTDGTDFTNEISAFDTIVLNMVRQAAEISGYMSVLARSTNQEELLVVASQLLENEKKLRLDQMCAVALTTNAGVANIDITTPPSTSPVHTWCKQMIGNLTNLTDDVRDHVFVTSPAGLARLLQEKNTLGEFIPKDTNVSFEPLVVNGKRQMVNLVGYFDGFEVYVTSGILATYTVDTDGTVTAQTGGTRTVIGFGLPYQFKLATTFMGSDQVKVFDENNTYANFKNGNMQIGLSFLGAAQIVSPSTWQYVAV